MEKEEEEKSKKIRCFIAVELPSEIQEKMAPLLSELQMRGVKPVALENIHVTLKFLGYVSHNTLLKVKEALSRVSLLAFSFSVKEMGCFPTEKRPRVVWVGCESVALQQLGDEINTLLAPLFPKETFTAHLTLARVKDMKDVETREKIQHFITKHKNDLFGTIKCTHFLLKESQLRKSGPIYSTLETFSLRA
ncbi:RNA 2',3'-cyclic phosphodiesterase [Candidatus Woesearchaeota archaeon]|nr:RNA 2',3'-cyclic phosphodiesterase [Candidatus Woesearchaeota archaeon]